MMGSLDDNLEWQVKQQYSIEGHLEVPADLPDWEIPVWNRIAQDIKNEEDMRIER